MRTFRRRGGGLVVIGFGRTGEAVAAVMGRRGVDVAIVDDHPSPDARARAEALDAEFLPAPRGDELEALLGRCAEVVVSPGVPPGHPVYALAPSKIISEIELAARSISVPIVAITGTNGKTTVTTIVDAMLTASGKSSTAAGNIGPTLIEASERTDLDVVVAEVSSFQLALTREFRPHVATWLNFAADHLDWHASVDDYRTAKSRIFSAQLGDDIAVVNAGDPAVLAASSGARSRRVTFGARGADYVIAGDRFLGPSGADLGGVEMLTRSLPHDKINALAALATAIEAGADPAACGRALGAHRALAHRVEHVASVAGVDFYDDSKATTPSAVVAALSGFSSVVLIAGGRNKGLDLSVLATPPQPSADVRAVICIGEAAHEVRAAFRSTPTTVAASMNDAIKAAFAYAHPGDAVLLSPGCASFDAYSSYAERGEDFVRAVHAFAANRPARSASS